MADTIFYQKQFRIRNPIRQNLPENPSDRISYPKPFWIENPIRIGRRMKSCYLASKMLGLRKELGLNLAESFQNDQLNFRSAPSEVQRGKIVTQVFPSAPFEGTDLVNNGTGLNIAYGGKSECL